MLNLDYPGGPQIEMFSKDGNDNAFKLPRPMYIDPVAYNIGAMLRLLIGFLPFIGKSSIIYRMYNPTKTYERLDNEFIGSLSNPVLFASQNPSFSIAGSTPFQMKRPKMKNNKIKIIVDAKAILNAFFVSKFIIYTQLKVPVFEK